MAADLTVNEKYRRKYDVLSEKCREIEQDNRIMAYKLREIRRVVSKLRSEKRLLMRRLDQYGDEYRKKPAYLQQPAHPRVSQSVHRRPEIRVVFTPEALHPVTSFIPIQMPVSETRTKGKSPQRKGKAESRQTEKGSATGIEKKRKVDDPTMPPIPRKPANAFLLFCQQNRESTLAQCGVQLQQQGQAHHELTRMLAKKWKEMASPDKKIFYELYEQEKVRYAREMEEFQAAGGVMPTKASPSGRGTKKQGKEPKRKKGKGAVTETPVPPGLDDTNSSTSSRLFASPYGYEATGLDDDGDSLSLHGDYDVKSALAVSPHRLPHFMNQQTPSRFSESPAISSSNEEEEPDDMLFQ